MFISMAWHPRIRTVEKGQFQCMHAGQTGLHPNGLPLRRPTPPSGLLPVKPRVSCGGGRVVGGEVQIEHGQRISAASACVITRGGVVHFSACGVDGPGDPAVGGLMSPPVIVGGVLFAIAAPFPDAPREQHEARDAVVVVVLVVIATGSKQETIGSSESHVDSRRKLLLLSFRGIDEEDEEEAIKDLYRFDVDSVDQKLSPLPTAGSVGHHHVHNHHGQRGQERRLDQPVASLPAIAASAWRGDAAAENDMLKSFAST
ncbi:hypothetical protein Cni_G19849 [Canna indica]|uniref:Uncharacterized protein n=1 Tax=Canna indica TaxID=4628 RepID=A0AAQ3KL88_9LILI|nr:hypothetical protein Cni_G19849 [Canna indica]